MAHFLLGFLKKYFKNNFGLTFNIFYFMKEYFFWNFQLLKNMANCLGQDFEGRISKFSFQLFLFFFSFFFSVCLPLAGLLWVAWFQLWIGVRCGIVGARIHGGALGRPFRMATHGQPDGDALQHDSAHLANEMESSSRSRKRAQRLKRKIHSPRR